jgi:tRNA (guanine-N7-)-methyltransferase
MSRKKLKRFAQLKELHNVLDENRLGDDPDWIKNHFKKTSPLIVEVGCGKGEYTLALARRFHKKNILGIDRKGARLWKGAKTALNEGLDNAAFLRIDVKELGDYIQPSQVDEIWIPFPDPLVKRRQAKHRLVSRAFLETYRLLLREGGRIHVKTDHKALMDYLMALLRTYPVVIHQHIRDVHACQPDDSPIFFKTTFEQRHLEAGKPIQYLCFSFRESNGKSDRLEG